MNKKLSVESKVVRDEIREKIDKNSFVPPFYQLAAILEQKIFSGRWKPGESLPSENELGKEYHLSRATVRKCLNLLAERGMVSAERGRGTFVSRLSLDTITFVMNEFNVEMAHQGKQPGYRLVKVKFVKNLPEVAQNFGMDEAGGFIYYCRLLLADNEPLAVEHKYIRYCKGKPIIENEFRYKAFSEVIALHTEVLPVKSHAVLTAAALDEHDAALLNVPVGFPALRMEQILYPQTGGPNGFGIFYYRADKYSIVSDIEPLRGEII